MDYEDEDLDWMIYDELSREEKNKNNGGCLSMVILLSIPVGSIAFLLFAQIAI